MSVGFQIALVVEDGLHHQATLALKAQQLALQFSEWLAREVKQTRE